MQEQIKDLQNLVNSIAEELPGFRFGKVLGGWGRLIRERDGLEIRVHISKKRLVLSMATCRCEAYRVAPGNNPECFRDALRHNENPPEITVSLGKAPAKIAKDIISRLLPMCEDLHARCLDVVQKTRKQYDDVFENMEVLGLESSQEFSRLKNGQRIEVSVSYDTVGVKLDNLTVSQASKILELFRSFDSE